MNCPQCGAPRRPAVQFCGHCGARLEPSLAAARSLLGPLTAPLTLVVLPAVLIGVAAAVLVFLVVHGHLAELIIGGLVLLVAARRGAGIVGVLALLALSAPRVLGILLLTLLALLAMQAMHTKTETPALHPWLPPRPVSFETPVWSGYVALSRDNHDSMFNQVRATWIVGDTPPQLSADGRTVLSGVSDWVGLGGDMYHNPQSTVLWQAGTADDRGPCGSMSTGACTTATFWYEDFGCSSPCPGHGWPVDVPTPTVHPGDSVSVVLDANGSVTFDNISTGQTATLPVSIDDTNIGLSAEWIAEESGGCPTPRGRWPYYACSYVPFADPAFTAASASGSTASGPLDGLTWTRADLMDQNGHVLAQPSPPSPATHGFGVTCCAP